jgi:hypothetical protein
MISKSLHLQLNSQGGFAKVYSYTQLPFKLNAASASSSKVKTEPHTEPEMDETTKNHVLRSNTAQAVKVVPHEMLGSSKKRTKVSMRGSAVGI